MCPETPLAEIYATARAMMSEGTLPTRFNLARAGCRANSNTLQRVAVDVRAEHGHKERLNAKGGKLVHTDAELDAFARAILARGESLTVESLRAEGARGGSERFQATVRWWKARMAPSNDYRYEPSAAEQIEIEARIKAERAAKEAAFRAGKLDHANQGHIGCPRYEPSPRHRYSVDPEGASHDNAWVGVKSGAYHPKGGEWL